MQLSKRVLEIQFRTPFAKGSCAAEFLFSLLLFEPSNFIFRSGVKISHVAVDLVHVMHSVAKLGGATFLEQGSV